MLLTFVCYLNLNPKSGIGCLTSFIPVFATEKFPFDTLLF